MIPTEHERWWELRAVRELWKRESMLPLLIAQSVDLPTEPCKPNATKSYIKIRFVLHTSTG
jgi:hypothetical protein